MIAIIAGTGDLPLEACRNLIKAQRPFFVVSLFAEDNGHQIEAAINGRAEMVAQECYKVGQVLDLLAQKKTTHVLFIGKVDKSNLFKHIKFDWLAVKIMASLIYKSDRDVMERLLAELHAHGIEVMKQDEVLKSLLVPPGVIAGTLTPDLEQEIAMGIKIATAIAHEDIGQTVVLKDMMVVAVEAIEGTDASIKRGILLGQGGVTVCKTARHDQNKKFDLPTLGPASLQQMKAGDVKAIAWSSSNTLIADLTTFIARANELKITLVSVDTKQTPS